MSVEPEADLNLFFDRIDQWITSANFLKSKVPVERADEILSLTHEQIATMPSEQILTAVFDLYGYIDSLQVVANREKGILEYCEDSVWRIIAPVINNYGDSYVKMDIKYNLAVKENPLAQKINVLKITTRARLTSLEHRIEHVKKRADVLYDIAKRRKSEHF